VKDIRGMGEDLFLDTVDILAAIRADQSKRGEMRDSEKERDKQKEGIGGPMMPHRSHRSWFFLGGSDFHGVLAKSGFP